MGGRLRTAIVLAVVTLAAAALAAAAQASVVVLGGTYVARPGEVNRITIDKHANDFSYTDPGAPSIDASSTSCTVAGDQVTCPWDSPGLSFDVLAGDQNDTITNTQGGYPYIELDAGVGDDQITANAFLPAIGGPGNDHLVGGPNNDLFYGGPGRFDPKGAAALPDNDRIEGLGGADVMLGDVGDDVIDGGEGGDHPEGGEGNDVEHGGPGDDFLDGLPGATSDARGAWGSDILDAGEGDDRLNGASDNGAPDTLSCGPGTDMVEVGPGDQVASDCEEIDQWVGCPGGGGCSVTLVVSAAGPRVGSAGAASSRRHRRRVILGARTAGVGRGARKQLDVRLNRGRVSKVLRMDGRARALIEVKVARKKDKPKRIGRTPFGLHR